MKAIYAAIAMVFCAMPAHALTNAQIRDQLKIEITGLQTELTTATKTNEALKKERDVIQQSLDSMRTWGMDQQTAATTYFNEREAAVKAHEAERKAHLATIDRYHRLKLLCSLLTGMFAMIFYLRSNGTGAILSSVSALSPYAGIVKILAPILVFVAGFLVIWLPL